MARIVIFGNSTQAELAFFYLTHESLHEVCCFTVDGAYAKESRFQGLPVVPFAEIEKDYSPSEYSMFIALGYSKMNMLRRQKYDEAKGKGYELISYVSPRSTTFCDITYGDNCFILENNVIQPFAKIGNNVTIWSGSHIGHHARIQDNCFITSHVVVSSSVEVGKNSFIGVNATVRDKVKIGERCLIGAGALILSDTEDESVYVGQPAAKSRVCSAKVRSI
jgi:sugar O-acyltransferase (sialic acid O-acetyltransferase NeuD family)